MVSLSHRRNVLIKEVDQYHLIAFFCWMCTAVHCTWGPPRIFLFCRWQMCPFKEKLLIYLSPYRNFLRRFLCLFYSRSDTVIYHAANKRICQVTDSLHLSNIDKLFSQKWLREVAKKQSPVFGLKKSPNLVQKNVGAKKYLVQNNFYSNFFWFEKNFGSEKKISVLYISKSQGL